jgi:hypothetical protein
VMYINLLLIAPIVSFTLDHIRRGARESRSKLGRCGSKVDLTGQNLEGIALCESRS